MISKSDLTEFKVKDGEFELSIRTKNFDKGRTYAPQMYAAAPAPMAAPASAPPAAPPAALGDAAAPPAPPAEGGNYIAIKSPMVGTFYRSSSPDKPAYAKVDDKVERGNVVCIIEAMKLFNEIESEVSGRIVKVMVEDAQPVEYDQVLFLVDPKG